MADLAGGQYLTLREGDPALGGHLCHFLMTGRGITYEVPEMETAGIYEPFSAGVLSFNCHAIWGTFTLDGTRRDNLDVRVPRQNPSDDRPGETR